MQLTTRSRFVRRRRVFTGVVGAFALLVALAATAWACTSSGGPLVHDLYQDRGPVGTTVSVGGEGWVAATPVRISWRPATGANQDLTSVETDAKGGFEVPVVVPVAPAGIHQLVVAQGGTARMTPFEVLVGADESGARARDLDALTTRSADEEDGGVKGGRSWTLLAGVAAALAGVVAAAVAVGDRSRRRVQARP